MGKSLLFLGTNKETGKDNLTMESEIHTFRESIQGQKSWQCIGADINLIIDSKGHGFYPISVTHPIPR